MTQTLAGKTALVTGASSGIGRATARLLAAEGVRVALSARSSDKLNALAGELGQGAFAITADMTRPAEVERMIAEAIGRLGHLDILFANAGIYVTGDVAGQSADSWEELLAVNVAAVFRAVRAALPHMQKRRSGDIIVTSSIAGHEALPMEPVYSASKHAINAFVYGLRRQLIPDNIRVGAVAPGTVLNELWGITEEAEIARQVAERTGIRSEDVADAVLYMLTRPPHVTIRDIVIMPQALDL
ncbi:MAG TPA: SDR family oxidoreductase [Dongiaceae bacterium]|jgi:ribitol 2-dehydrogenase|nr:SDR family oxidoreductase [Dongiaceae bacterium]